MATFTPSLSAKADKVTKHQEILIRFCGGVGKVFRIKTRIFVDAKWLSTAKNAKKFLKDLPTNPEAQKASTKYEGLVNFLKEAFEAASTNPETITKEWLETLVDRYHNPAKYQEEEKPKTSTLLTAIRAYIEEAGTRVLKSGHTVTSRTITNLRQTERHITNFLSAKKQLPDIDITLVDKTFYNDFVNYLYGLGFTANTCGKHIKGLKTMLKSLPMAQRIECPILDKPRETPIISEDIANVALSEEELQRIADVELPSVTLDKVRDQFLMLAWTGCRYSDLDKLVKDNIETSATGRQFFRMTQQKTGNKVVIPILPDIERILQKYDYNMPRPMSNQKFNAYLKDVCEAAGLTDTVKIERTRAGEKETIKQPKYTLISAHTARRSFATNMYHRGMPSLMIMRLTGHKSERAFLAYIKVCEEHNAMRMLEIFENQNGIKVNDKEDKA